jgi:uncharacterized protein
VDIEHDRAGQRFVGAAFLAYQSLADGALDIYSVQVPSAARGRGIAGHLVAAAVGYARAEGVRIIPTCSYAATWFRAHPEAADQLEREP